MSAELDRLVTMHTYRRPAGSKTERKFTHRYLASLGCRRDAFGNWSRIIGSNPRHVWSSHTDTVHRSGGRQRLHLDAHGILSAHSGDCLGADDTAGVWLMCELIRRNVPGRYWFHYGEEKGCIGSHALVQSGPDWLVDIDAVIALDRRGDTDVITHQCGARTASDAFAHALASQLNVGSPVFDYLPDDGGLYTDSESYADAVAECTNLSIGYSGAHSKTEALNTNHALALLDRLSELDVSALPIVRTAGEVDYLGGFSWIDDGRYDDLSLPVARTSVIDYYDCCRECGEPCSDTSRWCLFCGCDNPIDVRGESDYLDAAFKLAQEEIRRQMRRNSPLWRKA